MDEINKLKTKTKTYDGIERENDNYLVQKDNSKLMEEIIKKYNKNTTEKQNMAIKTHDISLNIVDLKNKLNEKARLLSELNHREGATISNMKKNIYDTNKFTDNKKIYYLVSGIHLAILLTIIIGFVDIINSTIVVIVIVVLYIIIAMLLFTNYNKNSNRNKFNYNEFDIEVQNNGVCSFSPSTLKNSKNETLKDEGDLNKVKSYLNNTK